LNALSFFKPAFLWGLLFLAVPLLIHLLRRPKARLMAFSTLRFFREAAITATKMRRLRSLLLLLMRLLAVAAVVLLFARPYDAGDSLSLLRDPHLSLFTWIDPTPSMGYSMNNSTLYERGERAIDSLQKRSASTSRHFHFNETQGDFVLLPVERPGRAGIRHGRCGLDKVIQSWNSRRREVSLPCLMLVSDFQKATVGTLDSLLERYPPEAPVICLALAPAKAWNYSIHDARVNDDNGAATVSALLATQGEKLDSGKIEVTLSGVYSGGTKHDCAADDTATVTLETANTAKGPGGPVSLMAPDPLLFDNTDFFAFEELGNAAVVVLGPQETMFPVAAAFRAMPGNRWDLVVQKLFHETTYDLLDSAGMVVAPDLGKSSQMLATLVNGPSPGDAVLLIAFSGSDEGVVAANTLLPQFTRLSSSIKLVERDLPVSPVLPDTLSELWRSFPHLVAKEAKVYRYISGLPGTPLLKLENGVPLITSIVTENGRYVLLAATPLGVNRANNLCETGFFVPCLDRITRFALRSSLRPPEPWIAGSERRNPFYGSKKAGMVFNEGNVFLERWQTQRRVVFSAPGLYRIAPEGDRAYWIAVHADPQESRLEYTFPSVNEKHKNNLLIINEKQLFNALRGRDRLLSTLPWLLLFLFLLAEVLLWEKKSRSQN
jgi:hypothetical protein